MNCWDNDCKYLIEGVQENWSSEYTCILNPDFIIPDDDFDCPNCITAQNCLTCKHSLTRVYETGTIDDIEYRCPFQNNKVIYDDSNPMNCHHPDIPECPINKWELIEQ